jgi:pimeloyl-ACP methyl ester carboxylesterase
MLGVFSKELVVELARMSKAVYPGPLNQKTLSIENKRIVGQRYVHGSYGRGFCRVLYNDRAVVVAFRGTREGVDWSVSNFCAFPVPFANAGSGKPVYVHQGFQRTLYYTDRTSQRPSLDALVSILDEIQIGQRRLYITGHSLGGALATLAAAKLRHLRPELVADNLRGIVTFGAPAVGLRAFKVFYGELHDLTLRIVNAADAVPFTPPIAYYHVGCAIWLRDNQISADPGWRARLASSLALLSPRSFRRDHSMIAYIAALTALPNNTGTEKYSRR